MREKLSTVSGLLCFGCFWTAVALFYFGHSKLSGLLVLFAVALGYLTGRLDYIQ